MGKKDYKRKKKNWAEKAADVMALEKGSEYKESKSEKANLTAYTISRMDEEGFFDNEDSTKPKRRKKRK